MIENLHIQNILSLLIAEQLIFKRLDGKCGGRALVAAKSPLPAMLGVVHLQRFDGGYFVEDSAKVL